MSCLYSIIIFRTRFSSSINLGSGAQKKVICAPTIPNTVVVVVVLLFVFVLVVEQHWSHSMENTENKYYTFS
jgi:uncharacterized membrane protein